jgi:hypothetical protein
MDRLELVRERDFLTDELTVIALSLDAQRKHKDVLDADVASTRLAMERLEQAEKDCSTRLKNVKALIETS